MNFIRFLSEKSQVEPFHPNVSAFGNRDPYDINARLAKLHPEFSANLKKALDDSGLKLGVTDAVRTQAEQDALKYRQDPKTKQWYTNQDRPVANSVASHGGYAIDVNPADARQLNAWLQKNDPDGKKYNLQYLGNADDVHIQAKNWQQLSNKPAFTPSLADRAADTTKSVVDKAASAATSTAQAKTDKVDPMRVPPPEPGSEEYKNRYGDYKLPPEDKRGSIQRHLDSNVSPYSPTAGMLSALFGKDWRTDPNAFTSRNAMIQAAKNPGLAPSIRIALGASAAAIPKSTTTDKQTTTDKPVTTQASQNSNDNIDTLKKNAGISKTQDTANKTGDTQHPAGTIVNPDWSSTKYRDLGPLVKGTDGTWRTLDGKSSATDKSIVSMAEKLPPGKGPEITGVVPGTKSDLGFDSSMLWGKAEKRYDGKWYDGLGRALPADKAAEAEKRAAASQPAPTLQTNLGKVDATADNSSRAIDTAKSAASNTVSAVTGSANATPTKAVAPNVSAQNNPLALDKGEEVVVPNSKPASKPASPSNVGKATDAGTSASAQPIVSKSSISPTTEPKPGSWQSLYKSNQSNIGTNPDLIKPGQSLTIPGQDKPYTVKSGDTLSGIASNLNKSPPPVVSTPPITRSLVPPPPVAKPPESVASTPPVAKSPEPVASTPPVAKSPEPTDSMRSLIDKVSNADSSNSSSTPSATSVNSTSNLPSPPSAPSAPSSTTDYSISKPPTSSIGLKNTQIPNSSLSVSDIKSRDWTGYPTVSSTTGNTGLTKPAEPIKPTQTLEPVTITPTPKIPTVDLTSNTPPPPPPPPPVIPAKPEPTPAKPDVDIANNDTEPEKTTSESTAKLGKWSFISGLI